MQITIPWHSESAVWGKGGQRSQGEEGVSVPIPNEIDVPASISVRTAGGETQHAGMQRVTHNPTPQGGASEGLVRISLSLSVKANSISLCLFPSHRAYLILFPPHKRTHTVLI